MRCARHTVPRAPRPGRIYGTYAWQKISKEQRERVPFCERCGSAWDLTADHAVPLARGGEPLPGNGGLVTLCRRCNSSKGAQARG
jgi:5-methylcytosine-specific restriction endonuclease McrA